MRYALSVLIAAGAALAQTTPKEALLVVSKGDLTVAIVDPATLKVVAKMPSGPDPHEVAATTDGRTAYVSNYGTGRGGFNTLTVADLVNQKPLGEVSLGQMRGPHGLWSNGGKIFFTSEMTKSVGRFDPATKSVDWAMGTGQNTTHMVVTSPDQHFIYTVNILSGTATIMEKTTQPPGGRTRFAAGADDWSVSTVKLGEPSEEFEGFDVSPDGKELWTASPRSGKVVVVDIANRRVAQTLDAKVIGANRVKVSPDGKKVLISVLSFGGGPQTGNIVVLDALTKKEIKRIDAGAAAGGILISPDGTKAYASCSRDNYVAVIDMQTLALVGKIDAGKGPDGLGWVSRKD